MAGIDAYEVALTDISPDEFVEKYSYLVSKIAHYYRRKLPSCIDFEDLLQSGFIGLLEARNLFQSNRGAKFETFATLKIKGAIVDSLRKSSWGTRESITNIKQISEAMHQVEQRTHRQATTEEIATEMNLTSDEYSKMSYKVNACYVVNIDSYEINISDNYRSVEQEVEYQDIKEKVLTILQTLPKREKLVLSLYYIEELTLKEIGEVLDLTEARISQIHSQAIIRIQSKLNHPVKTLQEVSA